MCEISMGGVCKPYPPIDKEKACGSDEKNRRGRKAMISGARKQDSKDRHDRSAQPNEPRNYSNPDPVNTGLEGRVVTVSMIGGRVESGKLKKAGQYFIEMTMTNGKPLIIAKSAIITVSVL